MKDTLTGVVVSALIAHDPADFRSAPVSEARVTFEGLAGDRHAGLTMRTGGRHPHFPRGTEIRNTRQISIVSVEEMAEAARALGVPELRPEWLGANLLLRDIPRLTQLPPGTRLIFPCDAVLVVEGENHPCTKAGGAIQQAHPNISGLARAFPKAAARRRGVVAWVERPGAILPGDHVAVQLPIQRVYELV